MRGVIFTAGLEASGAGSHRIALVRETLEIENRCVYQDESVYEIKSCG